MCNTHGALRVSKTVFLEEKGTFWNLSHEKGTLFFLDLYVSALFNNLFTSWCVNVAKGTFSTKNLGHFFCYLNSFRGDFHQEVKTCLEGVWRNFGHPCVHCYIWVPPPKKSDSCKKVSSCFIMYQTNFTQYFNYTWQIDLLSWSLISNQHMLHVEQSPQFIATKYQEHMWYDQAK